MIPSEPYALGESTPELIAAAVPLILAAAHAFAQRDNLKPSGRSLMISSEG